MSTTDARMAASEKPNSPAALSAQILPRFETPIVPRTVFFPVPRVDSVLVALRRLADSPPPELGRFVHAAFAHRRKALAGSLALAPGAPPDTRARARAALERMGQPADARAERLAPHELAALAIELRKP